VCTDNPPDNISCNNASVEFLEEIKLQFAREIDVKERLDNKASNLITMAAAVTTLFMGFGAFLLKELEISNIVILGSGLTFLILEVIITIAGIWRAITAYGLKRYKYPIVVEPFRNLKGELDDEEIRPFRTATKEEFQLHMINEYLDSMNTNFELNKKKAGLIKQAHILYLIALIMIVPFAFTIVIARIVAVVP
jgi:hypothetical protein